jgi:hypothetical protein
MTIGATGSWHVESKEFPIILDYDGVEIARAPFTRAGRRNGRLLAAAPELLAAAKLGLHCIPKDQPAYKILEEAIATAEGGP